MCAPGPSPGCRRCEPTAVVGAGPSCIHGRPRGGPVDLNGQARSAVDIHLNYRLWVFPVAGHHTGIEGDQRSPGWLPLRSAAGVPLREIDLTTGTPRT